MFLVTKIKAPVLTLSFRLGDQLQAVTILNRTMSSRSSNPGSVVAPYTPPEWARKLQYVPSYKLDLSMHHTPVHKWNIPSISGGFRLSIKRDDINGGPLSGNKVRKLEFLLADAIYRGFKHVITAGGVQSNHCRATAIAARQHGLQPHLFLRSHTQNPHMLDCVGNLFLDRIVGSDIYLIPQRDRYERDIKPKMQRLADEIQRKHGERSYLIPIGGSDQVGLFGYITQFQELIEQGVMNRFDDIVVTIGSGGTACGLAIGNYLTGSKLRIHAICVCDSPVYFHQHISDILDQLGLSGVKSEDIINIIDGHKGRGYGISTEEELTFIASVANTTGILLDPVYTGKAARGMVHEFAYNADRFQGNRILFIHTGGIFGLMDGRMEAVMMKEESMGNKVYDSIKISMFNSTE
ncbi:PREDICTED: bifunctional D-cysteine desulfhydrase/1-aminocyclopropane-1-carboxylate deaminase, mitochondrial-like [Priapulus caudatus]|uniref:Bifunctional D-cysteine desulfhydrase/1-aminocyclopropane-1-carboxylate deaminase, mitochondrial-like n=1 Tax=Priapulus caudatus TaxID=37621 RepID=A0ABM1ECZ7_PRICU|nr:PREDICTED: bifunctional D-cysteine desulfhydrase/1-aminocyclopropane-1-carboxylate deaminase, mitochondrial-like [Priapulus caudatus]